MSHVDEFIETELGKLHAYMDGRMQAAGFRMDRKVERSGGKSKLPFQATVQRERSMDDVMSMLQNMGSIVIPYREG